MQSAGSSSGKQRLAEVLGHNEPDASQNTREDHPRLAAKECPLPPVWQQGSTGLPPTLLPFASDVRSRSPARGQSPFAEPLKVTARAGPPQSGRASRKTGPEKIPGRARHAGHPGLVRTRFRDIRPVQKNSRKNLSKFASGGERTRTADFYVANVALYQLSYTPGGSIRIALGGHQVSFLISASLLACVDASPVGHTPAHRPLRANQSCIVRPCS